MCVAKTLLSSFFTNPQFYVFCPIEMNRWSVALKQFWISLRDTSQIVSCFLRSPKQCQKLSTKFSQTNQSEYDLKWCRMYGLVSQDKKTQTKATEAKLKKHKKAAFSKRSDAGMMWADDASLLFDLRRIPLWLWPRFHQTRLPQRVKLTQ